MALLLLAALVALPAAARAAEVLQVSGADRLIIGDRNRVTVVVLGCMAVEDGSDLQAQAWLRQRLPRHSRVNLRPLGERHDQLVALVTPVASAEAVDLSAGLVAAGLAHATPCT